MAYDAGLVERLRDALARSGEHGTRERGVFGGRGFLLGKSTFVIAYEDNVLVKATPNEYPELLALPGITPFAPGHERPMGTWLVVPADAIADDPELLEWVERGIRGVRAAPLAKIAKRKTSKAKETSSPASKKPRAGRSTTKRSTTKRAASKRSSATRPAVKRTSSRSK
jgi:TfoX/Sxy family transcriptional regulator of competence genes